MLQLFKNLIKKFKMNKKSIGILTHITDPTGNTPSFGLNAAYLRYFRKFGNVIMIDPGSDSVVDVDLLVLPGGRDVNPIRYGEVPDLKTGHPDIHYEWFDTYMLQEYINRKIPIFGICRGLQTLNVHFGGKLNQHIFQDYSGEDRSKLVESIKLFDQQPVKVKDQWITGKVTWGGKVVDNQLLKINSLHHQGIYDTHSHFEKTISSEMIPLAKNTSYGNIEAIMHKELPIIAVQWHPEEMGNDPYSELLINHLLMLNK